MAKPNKKDAGLNKSRPSNSQKKARLQQILLAVIGIILIISMVMALAMNY
jgi:hypothetical protein